MNTWAVLEDDLIRYRDLSVSIKRFLSDYETECQMLIKQMANRTFEDVQVLFDALYDIQDKLATAKYKYEYPLNDRLQCLVCHLDRDDIHSRLYWYKRFNEGIEWPVDE